MCTTISTILTKISAYEKVKWGINWGRTIFKK